MSLYVMTKEAKAMFPLMARKKFEVRFHPLQPSDSPFSVCLARAVGTKTWTAWARRFFRRVHSSTEGGQTK